MRLFEAVPIPDPELVGRWADGALALASRGVVRSAARVGWAVVERWGWSDIVMAHDGFLEDSNHGRQENGNTACIVGRTPCRTHQATIYSDNRLDRRASSCGTASQLAERPMFQTIRAVLTTKLSFSVGACGNTVTLHERLK